jgi:MFS family permease
MQICGAVGRVLLAGVADYFSMGTMILCLTGLATAATLLLTGLLMTSVSVVLVLASIGLLGFFSVSWNGTMIAQMARLSPPGRVGTMTSRLMIYYYSGAVAGPWIFSLIYNQVHSYSLTYLLLAVLPLVGAVSIFIAYLVDRRAAQ